MERKIGETFEYLGEKYIVEEAEIGITEDNLEH